MSGTAKCKGCGPEVGVFVDCPVHAVKQVYWNGILYDVVTHSPEQLHRSLDMLLAQYLVAHPKALPSKMTLMELLTWSHARLPPQEGS